MFVDAALNSIQTSLATVFEIMIVCALKLNAALRDLSARHIVPRVDILISMILLELVSWPKVRFHRTHRRVVCISRRLAAKVQRVQSAPVKCSLTQLVQRLAIFIY